VVAGDAAPSPPERPARPELTATEAAAPFASGSSSTVDSLPEEADREEPALTDTAGAGDEPPTEAPPPEAPAATESVAATPAADPEASGRGDTPAQERPLLVPPTAPQLRGRLVGPAAASVVAVILLGPDNILREAARVTPATDGRWEAGDLEPGRYRVQLHGGGNRALVSDPPFVLVDIVPGQSAEVPEIRVIRAL
jgi:hypothetical protein